MQRRNHLDVAIRLPHQHGACPPPSRSATRPLTEGCDERRRQQGVFRLGSRLQTVRRERLPKRLMLYIDPHPWGHVAEWLRNGLQNRVHQFNSGRGLHNINDLDVITARVMVFVSETSAPYPNNIRPNRRAEGSTREADRRALNQLRSIASNSGAIADGLIARFIEIQKAIEAIDRAISEKPSGRTT
jgi:hypothetical protein